MSENQGQDVAHPWESKTLWASVILAVAPLFPPVQALLIANPELATSAVAAVFAALRVWSGRKGGGDGKKIVLKK